MRISDWSSDVCSSDLPDAVKATGGRISLAVELAARMEHGHDDFQRRLAGEFGVRVDRHTAAVVDDGQPVADVEDDLDPVRMAGHRLVHAVVDHLGGEGVERALVGAPDVHAGARAEGHTSELQS